ncbi:MAG: GreA/GreB family elongation factor [Candidatus Wildermuthbacteria bacterium]|nr:GreA/GreB family elongation factor [Candidatus Wildermuthbacteria bacterium]
MPENKFHLTKEGFKRIKKEYERLLGFRDMKAKGEVPSIWHSEDVNPEYLAYQEDMTLLESRILEYENIVRNVELITPPKAQKNTVFLGATVTLVEQPGNIVNEYTILGSLEANPGEGKISSDSPVGRSILGKKIGEEVVISSPIRVVYRIRKITYSVR